MFKHYEFKFETTTRILFGWSREVSGLTSTTHTIYVGPWSLAIIVHH